MGRQNIRPENILRIYWEEYRGFYRINAGHEISQEEAKARAIQRVYTRVSFDWTGVIPVNLFKEGEREKSEFEAIING